MPGANSSSNTFTDNALKAVRAPKARGELAEARFLARAMGMGLTVSKPFGDSAKYDFVVDGGGGLKRVQVKSAWVKSGTGYQIVAGPATDYTYGQRRPYRAGEIDFLAAYVAPEDTWFVIPAKKLAKSNYVLLKMTREFRLAEYREAWRLLQGRPRRS